MQTTKTQISLGIRAVWSAYFVVPCLDKCSIICIYVLAVSKISRLFQASVAMQASLSLTWTQNSQRQIKYKSAFLGFLVTWLNFIFLTWCSSSPEFWYCGVGRLPRSQTCQETHGKCTFTGYMLKTLLPVLPCTLPMLTSPFVLIARELSCYACTCIYAY